LVLRLHHHVSAARQLYSFANLRLAWPSRIVTPSALRCRSPLLYKLHRALKFEHIGQFFVCHSLRLPGHCVGEQSHNWPVLSTIGALSMQILGTAFFFQISRAAHAFAPVSIHQRGWTFGSKHAPRFFAGPLAKQSFHHSVFSFGLLAVQSRTSKVSKVAHDLLAVLLRSAGSKESTDIMLHM